jgi:hypothetical protein
LKISIVLSNETAHRSTGTFKIGPPSAYFQYVLNELKTRTKKSDNLYIFYRKDGSFYIFFPLIFLNLELKNY